jgi:hypothetical protein
MELTEFCIKVFEDSDPNEERAGEQEQLHKELRKCLLDGDYMVYKVK